MSSSNTTVRRRHSFSRVCFGATPSVARAHARVAGQQRFARKPKAFRLARASQWLPSVRRNARPDGSNIVIKVQVSSENAARLIAALGLSGEGRCSVKISYWTVRIPWSDAPTGWHPTDRTGPFAVLTRGAFATKREAHEWARTHLAGQPYTVKRWAGAEVAS